MRMGKPEKVRRGQIATPTVDANGKIPKYAARGSVVGKLSPDIISVYFSPKLTTKATESLERYSDECMQYDDAVKQYEEEINEQKKGKTDVEIDEDGTSTVELPPQPIPPKAPLYRSEYWVTEFEEMLSDTKDYFQAKNGGWKAHARAARFERIMDERYGRFRPLVKEYPELEQFIKTVQRRYATGHLSPFRQGKPPIPKSTAVIILFMMQRGNLRWEITVLAVLFFLVGLQPWALVILIAAGQALLDNRKRRPRKPMKMCIPSTLSYYVVEEEEEENADNDKNNKEQEEKERQRKLDLLKQPVGTKLVADEFNDSSSHQYDTIILGSGPSTLYTAALLSRTGRKVLVLSSKDDASGCYTFSGSDVPFDIESSDIARCSKLQAMLAPALCSSTDHQGGIRLAQIGSTADGHAFQILSVPGMGMESSNQDGIPFVLRADGVRSLIEDAAISLGDGWPGVTLEDTGNSASAAYVQVCNSLNASSNQFFMSKILDESVNKLRKADIYQEATIRYASSFLDSGFPLNAHTRSLMAAIGMNGENIKPNKTSMGAHVTNICSAMSGEGMHYPIGGPRALCHAFQRVIEENGGRVLTHVPYNRLLFDDSSKVSTTLSKASSNEGTTEEKDPSAPRCVGIQLIDKREIKFDLENFKGKGYQPAVLSMLGLITTFIRLLPNEQRDKYNVPAGLPALAERRPVIKILFALKGSAKDLDVTGADYYRLPAAALAQDEINQNTGEVKFGTIGGYDNETEETAVQQKIDDPNQDSSCNQQGINSNISSSKPKKCNKVKYEPGISWMQISFPSAKDPSFESRHGKVTTCVVTIEADDDFVTPFETKPKLYAVQGGKGETHGDYKWLMDRVRGDLLKNYPQLEGKITRSEMAGPPLSRGLSHTPIRYAAKGVRPESPYPGLFSGGSDLTIGESFSASIVGGWLAANAVAGYSALDHLFLQKNITSDIIQYLEPPDLPEDGEDLAVDFSVDDGTYEEDAKNQEKEEFQ